MVDLLSIDHPDPEALNFSRYVKPEKKLPEGQTLSSFFWSPLPGSRWELLEIVSTDPYFDSIARDSFFFTNFFVTRPPTARAVFTTMVWHSWHTLSSFCFPQSSYCGQYTIVNALEGYKKMYFLGGSASWGNVRGMLAHNINGLEIYEEGIFQLCQTMHGGYRIYISLKRQTESFVSRTSRFSLCFIPPEIIGHTPSLGIGRFRDVAGRWEKLKENGFDSLKDYNGMRFLDYSLGHFFRLVSKEDYYRKTIFCMFADHGTVANQQILGTHYPWRAIMFHSWFMPQVTFLKVEQSIPLQA